MKQREPYIYTMPEAFMHDQSVPAHWRMLGILNGFFINHRACFASNAWFMEQLGCAESTVSEAVKKLETMNLIKCKFTRRSRSISAIGVDPDWSGSDPVQSGSKTPIHQGPNSDNNSDNVNSSAAGAAKEVPSFMDSLQPKNGGRVTYEHQVRAVIEKFRAEVDPKNEDSYKRKVQRDAAEFLIRTYGMDLVMKVVGALPHINKNAKRLFVRQCTTPLELKGEWVKIRNAVEEKKEDPKGKVLIFKK